MFGEASRPSKARARRAGSCNTLGATATVMGTGWRVDSGLTAIVGNLNRVGAALIAAIKLARAGVGLSLTGPEQT